MCEHSHTITGTPRSYTHSVAVHPYTDENRAAHGGIENTETCADCGAKRKYLSNGRHREYGPWEMLPEARRLVREAQRRCTMNAHCEDVAAALRRIGWAMDDGLADTPRLADAVLCAEPVFRRLAQLAGEPK